MLKKTEYPAPSALITHHSSHIAGRGATAVALRNGRAPSRLRIARVGCALCNRRTGSVPQIIVLYPANVARRAYGNLHPEPGVSIEIFDITNFFFRRAVNPVICKEENKAVRIYRTLGSSNIFSKLRACWLPSLNVDKSGGFFAASASSNSRACRSALIPRCTSATRCPNL